MHTESSANGSQRTTREMKTKTVEDLRASVLELKEEISSIEQNIKKNEAKQQKLEDEIKEIRNRINKQMIISQRDQHKNIILTLISEAESFTDIIKNFRYFEHFSRQGMDDISTLKILVEELNQIINQLEADRRRLVNKKTLLEEEEALLVKEINQLIEIEKQLQIEIQKLQSYILDAEEVKKIVEEQRKVIIKESDDYFGIPKLKLR